MRVAVGLSGGVDSSVAALLLKERGFDVTGVTMKLWRGQYKGGPRDACFGAGEAEDIETAQAFARQIGIPYKVFDVSEEYDGTIVRYFRETYLSGKTPNPCVFCNATMKFGLLPRLAAESGLSFDAFATGHYARIAEKGSRHALLRAVDLAKDQSYFLYRLAQEQLARQMFPLGGMTKAEVREIARANGLAAAVKPDSQDFYSGDVNELIGEPDRPGDIVDVSGKVLGRHSGFWHFTIGQRKGLGIGGAGEPYYVIDLNACRNQVVVGRADEAVSTSLEVADMNWVSVAPTEEEIPCRVKVRSAGKLVPASLCGSRASFPSGIAGVAPGQSAVFYAADSEELLAGGIIQ
ncbi:MAG: tRNA 2-thiouridine(34) synthase MnmA [Kiritimatiellae bacterium]|nr:tRNA 2-thiouridine(34) synthase MnmA [Kiritimatiellia bacterium]